MRRIGRWLVGAAALWLGGWTVMRACAPVFDVAVFSFSRHPDFPRDGFLNEKLGVLRPNFARSYFVIAYRHITGAGFSPGEREQVRGYWADRRSTLWDRSGIDWAARWDAARLRVPGVRPQKIKLLSNGTDSYSPETHSFAVNCVEDAFRTAVHTLEARTARFGAGSREVREWLRGQDQVFANCDDPKAQAPAPLNEKWPALLRADRAYQIAAAHFYARQEPKAVEEFSAIAQDAASPWHTISNYLVVRSLYRMTDDVGKATPEIAARAQTEAHRILQDRSLAPIHAMTEALFYRFEMRTHDTGFFDRAARRLSSRGQENGLRDDLYAYTTIWDRYIQDECCTPPKLQPGAAENLRGADLTDWILNMQCFAGSCGDYSYAKWKKSGARQWLVAAIANADASSSHARDLIDAGSRVGSASPEYETVTWHRLRLMLDLGLRQPAREELDALLGTQLPKSSANLFRSLRMRVAPDLTDFLRSGLKQPVMITSTMDGGEVGEYRDWLGGHYSLETPRLGRDSIKVLNERTPVRLLTEAALGGTMPQDLRRDFLLVTFTRAWLLNENALAGKLAEALGSNSPELRDWTDKYAPASGVERKFAGAFLLLHTPEARAYYASGLGRQEKNGRIESYRDNWWCGLNAKFELDARANEPDGRWLEENRRADPDAAANKVAFLPEPDRREGRAEYDRLLKTGAGPDALTTAVLEFARAHAEDPRVPEALHLSVRAARYACGRDKPELTQRAFQLLHTRYPASPWAKKTPIWQ